jgi:hypothetical protein
VSGSVASSLAVASLSMAGVAPALSSGAAHSPSTPGVASPPHGAGSLKWQRARLVLDQHQRRPDADFSQPSRPDAERVLPVRAELADLLPLHGLRRGSTVVVRGSTTVLLALLAEATAGGSWAAVVGMPNLGILAAAELGVAIPRLALIPNPGPDYPDVVAALLDGIDLVAVTPPNTRRGPDLAHRLSARARHRKSILLVVGNWPGADLDLNCTDPTWSGLGEGHGHLTAQEIKITVRGRGVASRPTSSRITLPNKPTLPRPRTTTQLRVVGPADASTSPGEPNAAWLPDPPSEVGSVGTAGLPGDSGAAPIPGSFGEADSVGSGLSPVRLPDPLGEVETSSLPGEPNSARIFGPPGEVGPSDSSDSSGPSGSIGLVDWSGPTTEPADPAEWPDPAWLASLAGSSDRGRLRVVEAG